VLGEVEIGKSKMEIGKSHAGQLKYFLYLKKISNSSTPRFPPVVHPLKIGTELRLCFCCGAMEDDLPS
jgi:hypothetical protein